MKPIRSLRHAVARIEPLESRIAPATFLVTNTNDTGAGSLRQAILDANAAGNAGGPDLISFANIPMTGPFVIQPLSPLPAVGEAVIIDGYTAPNTSVNTLANGTDAVLRVELDISLQGPGQGLILGGAGGSVVSGLVVYGTTSAINGSGNAILIESSSNVVAGNFIGTDSAGDAVNGNANAGVEVGDLGGAGAYVGNVIGGFDPADRNLLSGNLFGVVLSDGSNGTLVAGNLIGTDATGLVGLGNIRRGVQVSGIGNFIGSPQLGGGNVIVGSQEEGIAIFGNGNFIKGNLIGLGVDGLTSLPNLEYGIALESAVGNVIGGAGIGEGNVISANGIGGILLGGAEGESADSTTILGNRIGTDASGVLARGNIEAGISINGANGLQIGGTNPGEGNVIAFNGSDGVLMAQFGGIVKGVTVSGNSIHSNAGLGSNVAGGTDNFFGVSPNDADDEDAGPNGEQNWPVLTNFTNNGSTVTLTGSLASKADEQYRIEFFAIAPSQLDISGHGEGAVFLGSVIVSANANGDALVSFTRTIGLPADTKFTATATDIATGETSEFGRAVGPSATYTWNNSVDGDWFNPANWTPNGVPGALDSVVLNSGTIVLDDLVSVASFQQTGGVLGASISDPAELNIFNTWTWTGGSHTGGVLRILDGGTGTLGSTGGALNWLGGELLSFGAVTVNDLGVNFNAGAFYNDNGSMLTLNNAGFTDADGAGTPVTAGNQGLLTKIGSGVAGFDEIPFLNNGVVQILDGTFSVGSMQQNNGALDLSGGGFEAESTLFLAGGEVTGSGTINANVVSDNGTIRPGGFGQIGTITISGTYNQNTNGTLDIEIAGAGLNDQLTVVGNASLGGELQHSVLGTFVVRAGDAFSVLGATLVTGTFSLVDGNRPLVATYTGGDVSLGAPGFLVTNTDDSGSGSLRDAIIEANLQPGLDYISFDILGTGLQTIDLLSALPAIDGDIVINGYSQSGTVVNTLALGSNAVLLIELSGANAPTGNGLEISSGKAHISGLIINGWSDAGIYVASDAGGSTIVGNWIGIDSNGTQASTNLFGVQLDNAASVRIGTGDPRDRNVISGNSSFGIQIVGNNAAGNIIQGNYIGTTKSGGAALGNDVGIATLGNGTIIGGESPGEGNVISASTAFSGIQIGSGGGANSVVQGNLIGTDATGTLDLGNAQHGIQVLAANVQIGGEVPGAGNVISGNGLSGLALLNAGATGAVVYGNKIGTAINGISQIANNGSGILIIDASNVEIGGFFEGQGNIIALNGVHGVTVDEQSGTAVGVIIRGNSIFSNSGRGINLMDTGDPVNGVTANDPNDADTGPNDLVNFPTLTGFNAGIVSGTYHGKANTTLVLDFYFSSAADSSGNGEGEQFVGARGFTTDGSGNVNFNVQLGAMIPQGSFLTATATEIVTGSTSEFSPVLAMGGGAQTFVWDNGAGDSDWFNPINWDLDAGVPGALDTAVLNIASTIILTGNATVSTFEQTAGSLGGLATLTINSSFVWNGGAQIGTGTTQVAVGGTFAISGGFHSLSGRTVSNAGSGTWVSGPIVANSGVLRNEATGTFGIQAGASMIDPDGPGTPSSFVNAGTMLKTTSNQPQIQIPFNNTGTLDVQDGLIFLGGGGASSGAFTVSGAGGLFFSNTAYGLNDGASIASFTVVQAASPLVVTGTVTLDATMRLLAGSAVEGSGTFEVNGSLNWGDGTMSGSGITRVNPGGFLVIDGATAKTLDNRTVEVNGAMVVTGSGSLTLLNGAAITNNGLFDATSDITFVSGAGGGSFVNTSTGTLRKSAGVGSTVWDVPFTNEGIVQPQVGTMHFTGGYTQTAGDTQLGAGFISSTTPLSLQGGELTGVGSITGDVDNIGATIRPAGALAVGTITIGGNYTQGSGGTLEVELGGTGAGQFDVLLTGGALLDGTLNLLFLGGYTPISGDQFLVVPADDNPGTFATLMGATAGISQSSGATGLLLAFNSFTLTWDAGGGADTSWFNALNWDTDTLPGPADQAVLDTNATITLDMMNVTVNSFEMSAGTLTGNATLTLTSGFVWTGGTVATTLETGASALNSITGAGIKTLSGATMSLAGLTTMDATISLSSGATLENSGAFEIANGGNILGSGTFHHLIGAAGQVTKTGPGTIEIAVAFLNGSGLVVNDGDILLSGGGNWGTNVSATVAAGSTLSFTGGFHSFAGGNVFTGTGGTTRFSGGDLEFNGASSLVSSSHTFLQTGGLLGGGANLNVSGFFQWNAGTQTGAGATTILGGATWDLTGSGGMFLDGRTVNVAGTTNFTGTGTVFIENGATINNSGTFLIATDGDLGTGLGTNAFNNLAGGILRKTGGVADTDIGSASGVAAVNFTNAGTVEVQAGRFFFDDTFTQTAGTAVLGGGGISFLQTAQFQGGELRGSGSITGNVNNTGATIRPGSSPGILSIDGDLTLGSGSRIIIEVGGATISDFDQILLTGALNLGGTLEAELINGFVPSSGASFSAIVAGGTVLDAFDTVDIAPLLFAQNANGIVLAAAETIIVPPKDPFTFTDENGDTVKVSLTGRGTLNVVLQGGATDSADIASIEIIGSDLSTKLTVAIANPPGAIDVSSTTTIGSIFTTGALQHVGAIALGSGITLGDGVADANPELRVTGKMNSIVLDDLAANAFLKFGEDLPYELPGKDPDTKNNNPSLVVGDVLGAGVNIEMIGDGTAAGVGGGGFSKVTFHSWAFEGLLSTSQSIGKFLVETGDFFGVLKVDPGHLGEQTTANVGSMQIADGSWGSSGTEIEGNIGSFDVDGFLAGATITAGSMGSVKSSGPLAGTFILTDPDAGGVPTFTVNSDFSASIVSAVSIKKLKIKGDFTGSLTAPSIGSISAFSFLGSAGVTKIVTNAGKLGFLTSSTGVIRDYEIITDQAFSGIKVKARNLSADTVGIDNVSITAPSIGAISVDLGVAKGSLGIDLIGIRNSSFFTTGTGTTNDTLGNLGNVTVTLKGGVGGNGSGIVNATFDARVLAAEFTPGSGPSAANKLGNVAVNVKGFGAASIGISDGSFEGDTIGKTTVTVALGAGGTAAGVSAASFIATDRIQAMKFDGDVTSPIATGLSVLAGGKLDGLTVRAKSAAMGSLVDSSILAGQSLVLAGDDKALKAAIANASLGGVSLSGSLTNSTLGAGGNVGKVSVGADATDSLILAGASLGSDAAFGGGDDTYRSATAIAGIVVSGPLSRTSIAAGVDPMNGIFGDADDVAAAAVGTLGGSSIGVVTFGTAAQTGASAIDHAFAIQAAAIKSLNVSGLAAVKDFTNAIYLDGGAAGEDVDDILVRLRA